MKKIVSFSLRLVFWALLLAVAVGEAKENLVNVSWGDRIMVSPGIYRLDTPERIEEALLRWREAYEIDGIVWRISDERIREEYQNNVTAKFYGDYYSKIDSVRKTFNPIKTACDCARRNGQKFLLYDTFLDHGMPTNILYAGQTPFPWQDRLTIAHPDYQERDLAGNWQYGVLDLSQPEVRKSAVGVYVRALARYDADGVYVCNRTHAHPARHADQFGFSPTVVAEYKRPKLVPGIRGMALSLVD